MNNDSSEDPGCHWSSEPDAIVVEMPLRVRADHADDCTEIGSVSCKGLPGQVYKNCAGSYIVI